MVTIIIEDGTGLADANSYIDVSFVKKYAEDRGVDLGSDEVISANLILAADYMSTQGPFKDSVVSHEQALDFPRKGLYVHGEPFRCAPKGDEGPGPASSGHKRKRSPYGDLAPVRPQEACA